MDVCDLPTELILEIAKHLSFRDIFQLLLVNRRHGKYMSRVLYLKLLPLHTVARADEHTDDGIAEQVLFTRKDVLQWAIEHDSVRTLGKIDEAEALEPSNINYLTCKPTKRLDDASPFELCPVLPLHLAALCGRPTIVRYLLQKGAEVNAVVSHGLLPIHVAKTGEIVQILVASGSRLDTVNGATPLLCSLMHHADSSAVAAFLQLGADPNQTAACDGTTPAQVAVDQGNVDALKLLLEAGVDANRPLPGGEHLIYRAVLLTRSRGMRRQAVSPYSEAAMAIIRLLLDHGASANSARESTFGPTNELTYTPTLFLAVMVSLSSDVVQLLLERGADQHAAYSEKRESIGHYVDLGFQTVFATSLVANLVCWFVRAAPRYGTMPSLEQESIRKLGLLIQHGGNIDEELDDGTPLLYCLRRSGPDAINARALIPHLLNLGADPSHRDQEGSQPIHLLTGQFYRNYQERRKGWWKPLADFMTLLIEKGANPNSADALGRTPAMLLCLQPPGTPTALLLKSLLCRGGINVHAIDAQWCTALHHVVGSAGASFNDESCFRIQVLLGWSDATLGINTRDRSGQTPLHLLLESHNPSAVAYSFDKYGGEAKLRHYHSKRRGLSMLLRAGADATARRLSTPNTADDLSARIFGAEAGESLSVSGTEEMHRGYTPLHLACVGSHPAAMIKILLQHGAAADINAACGTFSLTPLMAVAGMAATGRMTRNTLVEVVQVLLRAGADTGLRDARGRTAWDIFRERAKTKFLWVWSPCLDGLMLEMTADERDTLLGLGAPERSKFTIPFHI